MMKKLAAALAMLVASACLALPGVAFAAGPVVTHDGDEIRALLESDGDAIIQLDDDVDWSVGRMADREMVEIQYPCSHTDLIESGLHPSSHKGSMQIWAMIGPGSKTIDLAGHQLHVSVDDAGTRWAEADTQLYLIDIPSGAALTVDDSSGTDKGEIRFDGYLHAGASGAAGSQSANYYNRDVMYRNVFRVEGGTLTYNGGTVSTRSKQQYISPGRAWDSLIGPAYSGNVRQQVNCTAITLLSGDVLVNGGVIEGRGYRFMYSGATNEGLWYSSEYWPAAALYAEGGNITVNAGTFNGMGGAHAFNVTAAQMSGGSSIKVRSGYFHTHKVDKVLVPAADDNGGNSGTGAPRYMNQGYGTVGLHGDFIDGMVSEVTVDGTTYTYDLSGAALNTSKDVTVSPAQSAQLDLHDTGTNAPVSDTDPLVWNGVDSRKITFVPDFTFQGYPWTDGYYQGIFESGKTMGVSSKITIGGTVHSVGGATVDSEKEITLSAAQVKAMLEVDGCVSFDLKDLLPDGLGAGDTFALRVRYSENLMPYDGARCAGSLVHAKNISVVVKPDALQVTVQPTSDYSGSAAMDTTTLTAQAAGATRAWWVKVWPTKDEYTDVQTGASFDASTGIAKLDGIPYGTSASYYRCYFSNDYSTAVSDVACVRMKLEDSIGSAGENVALNTNLTSGTLAVTGDLLSAFNATMPDSGIRSVTWYKDGSIVALDDRVRIVPSTPHLEIKNPVAGDAGTYCADVTVDFNGKPATFRTGNYNVTVDTTLPASIDRIDLFSGGSLYLGDDVPDPTEFFSSYDERYHIESATWNGAYAGQSFAVPTAYCSFDVSAAEGYSFANSGVVEVYMDGQLIGTSANMESGPPYTYRKVNATYKPKELWDAISRNALDEFIALEQGDSNIEKQLNPVALYNATGQVAQDAGVTSNSYSSSEMLSGLNLDASGLLTGTLAQDAALGAQSGLVKFRTNRAGSSELQSGITVAVLRHITPIALGALEENTHSHTWGAWADSSDNTHSRTCTVCGAVETASHNWDEGVVTVEPAPGAAGVITYTCADCGATKTSPAPYELHSHLVYVGDVAPTCEEAGTKAHYLCEECLLKFYDADALNQVDDDDDLVLPATGHDWGEWEVVRAPTPDAAGVERRVCRNDPSHVEEREVDSSTAVFAITYELNGGVLDGKTGAVKVSVTAGQTITLPKPERSGYEFGYWEGSRYDAGDRYTVTADHTFTAQWRKVAAGGSPSSDGQAPKGGMPGTGDAMRPGVLAAVAAAALGLAALAASKLRRPRKHPAHAKR